MRLPPRFKQAVKSYLPSSLRNKVQPRRFRAYGVGAPKTGTTSLDRVIGVSCRSGHEPDYRSFERFLSNHMEVDRTSPEFLDFLLWRDRQLWLDFEASWYMGHCIEGVSTLWPEAKYIITIRQPYFWLDSMLNAIRNFASPERRAREPDCFDWVRLSCRPEKFSFVRHDRILKEHGLIPLDSLLSFYRDHYRLLIETVDQRKCLIIKTRDLGRSWKRIGNFLGIDIPTQNDLAKERANVAPRRYAFLGLMDREFLADMVSKRCDGIILSCFSDLSKVPSELLAPQEASSHLAMGDPWEPGDTSASS